MLLIPIHLLTRWPSGDNPMCKYFGRRKKKKADQKAKEGEKTDASSVEREFFYFLMLRS